LKGPKTLKMKKPNFFILGAPKCGTTSLAAWLAEHPYIFISPMKEPNFFNKSAEKYISLTQNDYERLFLKAQRHHIRVGEATTNYLRSKEAVPNILNYVDNSSEVKFIVAIRNPVDMAISLHGQRLREGREVVNDFATAWRLQKSRAEGEFLPPLSDAGSLMYGSICRLGEQIERLFRFVNQEQVHIIVLDDVIDNPRSEYEQVLDFLELPNDERQEFPVRNEARSIPLWAANLQRRFIWVKGRLGIHQEFGVFRRINNILFNSLGKDPVAKEVINELQEYFKNDVYLLSNILDRDFSYWLDYKS
jgi:hypothetical protein